MSAYSTRAAILQEMDAQGVSQTTLGKWLGWSSQWLAKLLGGVTPLTPSQVEAIADALGVRPSQFLKIGRFQCPECGSVGSEPTHRPDCPNASAAVVAPAPAAAELHS